jgi:hypothetical protein
MTTSVPDRMREAFEGINEALNPRQVFALTWEYSVIAAKPGPPVTIDCAVVDTETSAHLPSQLTGLVLWPGPSGFVAVPQPKSIVRIGFINGDPSKPFVEGLDPNSTPLLVMGFATLIQFGDQGATPVAKATPLVTFLGALQTWAVAVAGALSSAGFPIVAPQAALVAAIASASSSTPATKVLVE